MNDFNQTAVDTVNQGSGNGFFTRKKTIILIVLAIFLVIESIWAFNFLSSRSDRENTQIRLIPEQSIASLTLNPQNVSIGVGEQFTTVVSANLGGREVNGIDAVINYDPQLIEVIDSDILTPGIQIANGDLFSTLLFNEIDVETGTITITASRISPGIPPLTVNGILAAITFQALSPGQAEIQFEFDPTTTSTSNVTEAKTSENILTTVSNATITITP